MDNDEIAQVLNYSADHRSASKQRKQFKGMNKGYMEEKFSYVVFQKLTQEEKQKPFKREGLSNTLSRFLQMDSQSEKGEPKADSVEKEASGGSETESAEEVDERDGDSFTMPGRVLFPVMVRQGHTTMDLCCEDGVLRRSTLSKTYGKKTSFRILQLALEGHRIESEIGRSVPLPEEEDYIDVQRILSTAVVTSNADQSDETGKRSLAEAFASGELTEDEAEEATRLLAAYNPYRQARAVRWGDVFHLPKDLISSRKRGD